MPVGLTPEQYAEACILKANGASRKDICRRLGVTRRIIDFAFRRGRTELEPTLKRSEAARIAIETGMTYDTVHARLKANEAACKAGKPLKDVRRPVPPPRAVLSRAKASRAARKLPMGFQFGRQRDKPALTARAREMVRALRASKLFSDPDIAVQFKCEIRDVLAIAPLRGRAGRLTRYDVGDEALTIPEIAKQAGATRTAIYDRIERGVRGLELLSPPNKTMRKPRRDKLTLEIVEARKDTLASRTGAPADFERFPTPPSWK